MTKTKKAKPPGSAGVRHVRDLRPDRELTENTLLYDLALQIEATAEMLVRTAPVVGLSSDDLLRRVPEVIADLRHTRRSPEALEHHRQAFIRRHLS